MTSCSLRSFINHVATRPRLQVLSRLSFVSLLALSLTALTACGGGGKGTPQKDVVGVPPAKPSYQSDEGEKAKMEMVNQVNPVGTYFQKRYNRPHLEGVLRASGRESVRFVQALKVDEFRVPNSSATPFFLTLNPVGSDLEQVWNQAAGGVSQGGSLAGLYFEACGYIQCAPNTGAHPTILIGQTSTRWVIVHEMMHHLFNMQRKHDGLPGNPVISYRLNQSIKKVQAMLDKFTEFNDAEYLMMAATEMDHTVELTKASLATSKLEETTVERVLVDEWAANRLLYVDQSSPKNAVWYMGSNAQQALDITDALAQSVAVIKDKATEAASNDVLNHLATIESALIAYQADIKKTVSDASAIVYGRLGGKPADPVNGSTGLIAHPLVARETQLGDCTGDDNLLAQNKAALLSIH